MTEGLTLMLTEQQATELVEYALRGARPPMKRALGESPRGHDQADKIAEGIGQGLRMGLRRMNLLATERDR